MSIPLLALLACVPPADPLYHQRAAFLSVDTLAPLGPDWPAQASLSLDPDVVAVWIAERVAKELQDLPLSLTLPGGVLGDVSLVQSLTVEPVEVSVAGGVLHVATPVSGEAEVVLQTLLGRGVEEIDWTGTVRCDFAVELQGSHVVARPHEPEGWGLELVLGESPDAVDATLGVLLEEILQVGLAISPPEPRLVAELPDARVRALRLRPETDALIVDFAFDVVQPGEVGAVPSPEGGFVAVLPESTALALARATVLNAPPTPELVEPLSLSLEGTGFELGLRHHVPRTFLPRRSYSLRGELSLEEGVLVARPETLQALRGPLQATLGEDLRVGLLADLTAALTVSLPARSMAWIGGEERVIEAVRIEAVDHQLMVWGRADE